MPKYPNQDDERPGKDENRPPDPSMQAYAKRAGSQYGGDPYGGSQHGSSQYGGSQHEGQSWSKYGGEFARGYGAAYATTALSAQPMTLGRTDPVQSREATMNAITLPELDAKLQAIEARMDTRVAEMTGRLDGYLARMEERDKRATELAAERDKRMDEQEKRMDERHAEMKGTMADIRAEMRGMGTEVRSDAKSLKITMIITAIASVLTIIFGIGSFNSSLLSSLQTGFGGGKDLGTATEQLKQTQEQLKELQGTLAKQATSVPK